MSPPSRRAAGDAGRAAEAGQRIGLRTGRSRRRRSSRCRRCGESISVTAPVVRCVTIANCPSRRRTRRTARRASRPTFGSLCTYVRRCASSHSAKPSAPALHDSFEPSQSTHAIDGSPRVGTIRRSVAAAEVLYGDVGREVADARAGAGRMNCASSQTSVSLWSAILRSSRRRARSGWPASTPRRSGRRLEIEHVIVPES